jgi:hypothetical protein
MEHRYTERKPLDLSVVISCSRVGLFRGQTLDLSLGGMQVRSDCVVMPLHAPVLVSFQPDPDNPRCCVQARGMVIHQRGNAFGLMFDDLEPASASALRALMQRSVSEIAVSA